MRGTGTVSFPDAAAGTMFSPLPRPAMESIALDTQSIVNGLIVFVITTLVTNAASLYALRKSYKNNSKQANREIVDTLISALSQDFPVDEHMVAHVSDSTARKYGVRPRSICSPREVLSDLMKEIIDSKFISGGTKHTCYLHLQSLRRQLEPDAGFPDGPARPHPVQTDQEDDAPDDGEAEVSVTPSLPLGGDVPSWTVLGEQGAVGAGQPSGAVYVS